MFPTPGLEFDIPVLLDVVNVEISCPLGLDVFDSNSLLVDNVPNHLWNQIAISKYPLRFEEMWKVKLIRKDDQLYVPLITSSQSLYMTAQPRKLHKQFAHLSAVKIYGV